MHLEDASIRGYADVSMASVFGLADKRLPAAFSLMAVFWLIGSAMLTRKKHMAPALQLTPMQRQLLDLFKAAPDGELSKEEICRTLWPGKPMTDDAMYSLIRHLKASLEGSGYEIETRRGFGYRLKKR
jgi:DNA-binding winged helix-turn-helix (wHTH) protein